MKTMIPVTGLTVANSGVTLMARVLGANGSPITRASLSSLTYSVRDLTEGITTVAATALTINDVVYDNLQNDPRWSIDSADNPGEDGKWGYNVLTTLGATLFSDFDVESTGLHRITPHLWQASLIFTPTTGAKWHVPFQFEALPTWE